VKTKDSDGNFCIGFDGKPCAHNLYTFNPVDPANPHSLWGPTMLAELESSLNPRDPKPSDPKGPTSTFCWYFSFLCS
jgi:hypothetical protein